MSLVSLAFSQSAGGVLGRSTVVGGLLFDAATEETLTLENDVTEHPVEQGADISDHIREKPDTLTISGVVGDCVIALLPNAVQLVKNLVNGDDWFAGASNPFGSSISGADLSAARQAMSAARRLPSSGRSRLMQAIATLYAARASKMKVAVVTGLRYYDNFYITSINVSRANDNLGGGMLRITINLKTVIQVQTQTGTLEYPPTPNDVKTASKASTTKNKGAGNQKAVPAGSSTGGKITAVLSADT